MSSERDIGEICSTFLWRIENFSFWKKGHHGPSIFSPLFKTINVEGCVWKLCLFSGYTNRNVVYQLQLFLCSKHKASCHYSYASMNCKWSLLDDRGKSLLCSIAKHVTVQSDLRLDLPDFPTYDQILHGSCLRNDVLTVQLCISFRNNFAKTEHISAVTRIEVAERSFTWQIKDFSCLQLDQEVIAPVYLDFSRVRENYKLKLSLTGTSLDDAMFELKIVAEKAHEQFLNVILSVLDKEQKQTNCLDEKHSFTSTLDEQTWIPSLNLCDNIPMKRSSFLSGKTLSLICKFTAVLSESHCCIERTYLQPKNGTPSNISNVVKNNAGRKRVASAHKTIVSIVSKESIQTSVQYASQQKSASQAILGEELLSMYEDHTLSDFELRSGDVSFPVHKNILSARSPVFKAMFCGDMKESSSNSMDVPDLDIHTLGRLLTFMYAGTMDELEWESAAKLYYAADKYQVQSLKLECHPILRSSLAVSNVCEMLELADRHQDKELRSWVHDFIQDNFDDVITSDEWGKFMERSYLAGKAMKEVYTKMAALR